MKAEPEKSIFVAFLRGINVGGHHTVPMASLQLEMTNLGFDNVITLLNSGNVIFKTDHLEESKLEGLIAGHLEEVFGFPIPVLVRNLEEIYTIVQSDPFRDIPLTKDSRLYVSFLKEIPNIAITLPWTSPDGSFQILKIGGKAISSVLDLSVSKTPKGMEALEQLFGKHITTRNWNTLIRIVGKMKH